MALASGSARHFHCGNHHFLPKMKFTSRRFERNNGAIPLVTSGQHMSVTIFKLFLVFCLTLSSLLPTTVALHNSKLAYLHLETVPQYQQDKSPKSLSISSTGHAPDPIEWQPPPCPTPEESITPCVCNSSKNEIICRGSHTESEAKLYRSFSVLSKMVPTHHPYSSLSINLRDLYALESDIFAGNRFNSIFLRGNNLTYISRTAFRGTESYVNSLYIYKTKMVSGSGGDGKYDLFAAVRSLVNLKKLTITIHNLTDIPDRAFTSADPSPTAAGLRELEEIVISNGTISSIGTEAFADLSKLNNILLFKNKINRIKSYAFRTTYRSNSTLFVDLTDNLLEPSSFEPDSLLGAQRPVKLNFGLGGCNQQLSYLPENVFRPFFEQNDRNLVDIGRECPFPVCDCRMAWTLNGKYMYRVKNFKCLTQNGSTVYYQDYMTNVNCVTDNETIATEAKKTVVLSQPDPNKNKVPQQQTAKKSDESDKVTAVSPKQTTLEPATTNTSSTHVLTLSPYEPDPTTDQQKTQQPPAADSADYCQSKKCIKHGLEMNNYLNRSVDPCESFYDYACNGWENNHLLEYLLQVLSNGGSEYDNFVKVRLRIEENLDRLLTVDTEKLNALSSNSITGSTHRYSKEEEKERISQVNILPFGNTKAMYGQCLNPAKGPNFEALQLILNDIGGWPLLTKKFDITNYEWEQHYVTIMNKYKDNIFIEIDSAINERSTKHLTIKSGSFIVSKRKLLSVKLNRLENYANYMLNTAIHFGAQNIQNETLNEIWDVIRFEKMIANIAKKNMENMIERKLDTIGCLIKEINWFRILFNVQNQHHVMNETMFSQSDAFYDVHYLIDLSRLLSRTDKRTIANYLGWRVIESFGFLIGGSAFVEIQQNFYSTESREGTKLIKKQCIEPITRSLPYLMARVYLDKHLPLHSRKNSRKIIEAVRNSFIQSMSAKNWIDDSKEELLKRVRNIHVNIGYPDWILDDKNLINYYSILNYTRVNESSPEELVRFYSKMQEVHMRHMLIDLGEKINKSHYWDPLPLYVGASYDIVDNIISIPMGLLQPPFYEDDRPYYLNFASLGSFFGHELSHSVTPRYTEFERLLPPWSDHFLKEYLSKAQCFVSQYTNYYDKTAEQHLDGMRTFEEDMSDLAGIQAAFNAYKEQAKESKEVMLRLQELPDFSTDMLFFLSFAQKWCRSNSRVQTRLKISKSVHSPEKYRVNGALSNLDAFAKAFNCSTGTTMNPTKKCESW